MKRYFWIFDMDGTLTVPVHNFDLIRKELGLASNKPILEEIYSQPQETRKQLLRQLEDIEFKIVSQTAPQDNAAEVLKKLHNRGVRTGILTRNSSRNAWETLKQCGLDIFFGKEDVIGREECKPKPDPQGIHLLIFRWQTDRKNVVMVGDYLFDVLAGQRAGVAAIGFSGKGKEFIWKEHTDYCVSGLSSLLKLPITPGKPHNPIYSQNEYGADAP